MFLVFRPPEYLSLKQEALSQDDTLLSSSEVRRVTECLYSPRVAFYTKAVTVLQTHTLGLKPAGCVDLYRS